MIVHFILLIQVVLQARKFISCILAALDVDLFHFPGLEMASSEQHELKWQLFRDISSSAQSSCIRDKFVSFFVAPDQSRM